MDFTNLQTLNSATVHARQETGPSLKEAYHFVVFSQCTAGGWRLGKTGCIQGCGNDLVGGAENKAFVSFRK